MLNRILTLDDIVEIIDSITADQLQKIARQIIVDDKLRLAWWADLRSRAPSKSY